MRLSIVLAFCTLADFSFAHDYEKGDRIAAGLAPSPAAYAPLNMALVGQLSLGDEAAVVEPVRTPQGILLTTDLALSGNYAYVGSWGQAMHIVDISQPQAMQRSGAGGDAGLGARHQGGGEPGRDRRTGTGRGFRSGSG